jgi:hypothetical protein
MLKRIGKQYFSDPKLMNRERSVILIIFMICGSLNAATTFFDFKSLTIHQLVGLEYRVHTEVLYRVFKSQLMIWQHVFNTTRQQHFKLWNLDFDVEYLKFNFSCTYSFQNIIYLN